MSQGGESEVKWMKCPRCGSRDLSQVERIALRVRAKGVTTEGYFAFAGGHDVLWETSTMSGVACNRCGWLYEGDDWLDRLIPDTGGTDGQLDT